jgi:hypothetical protein
VVQDVGEVAVQDEAEGAEGGRRAVRHLTAIVE